MMNKRKFIVLCGAVLTLAACAPTVEEKGASLVSKGYQITDVNVVIAKDATVGRFKKDTALAQKTAKSIQEALTSSLTKPNGGAKKAKLNIELTTMSLRSAGGRTLTGIDNKIIGNAVATDAKGQIIGAEQLAYAKKGARTDFNYNGLPIGLLLSGAVNAGNSGSGNDVKAIVDGFNSAVLNWAVK